MRSFITQNISDFSKTGPQFAFFDWQMKLKQGEKLPRGKWFQGKQAGRPKLVMDEVFLMNKK